MAIVLPPPSHGPAWRIPVTGRALAALCALIPGAAEAACRLALVLALDVSGSVDDVEYTLQLEGIAIALETPKMRDAILAFPDAPVSLAIFEWSASSYQRDILGWTSLAGADDLTAVVTHLRAWRRGAAPESTGLGAALRHAGEKLANGPACWRQVIDVSGDGRNNDWPAPRHIRERGPLAGITVNALVVGEERPHPNDRENDHLQDLADYFSARVLQGPDAFVEVAHGFEDYARAMARKLLREISAPPMGALPPVGIRLVDLEHSSGPDAGDS